jgi:signal peptidase I
MGPPSSTFPLTSEAPQKPSFVTSARRQVVPLVAWVAVALLLRWGVIEPRWIPSGSMLPTLQLQDRVLVEKLRPKLKRPLAIGTVVVFRSPPVLVEAGYDPKAALIKRVVGGPGDTLEVKNGKLWRNGEAAEPDWAAEAMDYTMAPITVPPDHVLVMGDNRNASLDSHLWGPLPSANLIGTAVFRYWPLQRLGWIRLSAPKAVAMQPSELG